jgi:hypothetical protein
MARVITDAVVNLDTTTRVIVANRVITEGLAVSSFVIPLHLGPQLLIRRGSTYAKGNRSTREKRMAFAGIGPDMEKESVGPDGKESLGNVDTGNTESYDDTVETNEKEMAENTISYQEARGSKTKMGPTSSTVEGN